MARTFLVVFTVSFCALILACGGQAPPPVANQESAPKIRPAQQKSADQTAKNTTEPVKQAEKPVEQKPAAPASTQTPQQQIDSLERELTKINARISEISTPAPTGRLEVGRLAVGQRGMFDATIPFLVQHIFDARTLIVAPVIDEINRYDMSFVLEGISTAGMVDNHVFGLKGIPLEVAGTRRDGIRTRFHVRVYENPHAGELATLRGQRSETMRQLHELRAAEIERAKQAEIEFRNSPEGKAIEAARLKKLEAAAAMDRQIEAEKKRLAREQEAQKKLQLALQLVDNARGKEETDAGRRFLQFAVTRLEELAKQYPGTGAADEAKQMLDEHRAGKQLKRPVKKS